MLLSLDGGLCLRPGGAGPNKNPFAGFGKGAGASLPKKVSSALFMAFLVEPQICALGPSGDCRAMHFVLSSARGILCTDAGSWPIEGGA